MKFEECQGNVRRGRKYDFFRPRSGSCSPGKLKIDRKLLHPNPSPVSASCETNHVTNLGRNFRLLCYTSRPQETRSVCEKVQRRAYSAA